MKTTVLILIFLSFIVGSIHVFPHFLFQKELGPSYRGIALLGSPDEENYLIPLKEVYEGNNSFGNAILFEHKTNSHGWIHNIPYPYILVGFFGKLFHISLTDMVILMDFLFPAVTFLLFFTLSFVLTTNTPVSMVSALVAVLAPHIFWGYSRLLEPYTHISQPYYVAFLPFSRLFNPQVSIIPVLLFIIAFYKSLKLPKSLKWMTMAGVLLGSNFYFYFFWSYLYPFVAIVFVLLLFLKKRNLLIAVLATIVVSVITALPVVLSQFAFFFQSHQLGENTFITTYSHAPIFTTTELWTVVFFAFAVFILWKRKEEQLPIIFIISLLLANLLVMNQQIITGIMVQPHHFTLYLNPMILAVAVGFLFWLFSKGVRGIKGVKGKRVVIGLLSLVGFLAISEGIAYQKMSYTLMTGPYKYMQNLRGVFDWLNKNSPPQSVVLGYINDMPLDQIPIYTTNNLYVSLHARHYADPTQDEFRHRLMNYALVLGMNENDFSYAISDNGQFHYLFWGFRYFHPHGQGIYFTYDAKVFIPQRIGDEWVEKYKQKLQKDIYQEIKTYRLDYILWGPKNNPQFQINQALKPYLTMVYEDPVWVVYTLYR